ncbi:3-dehydroquinate synthase [Ruminococcaceae bacterium OttesenSCG-928-A16]|nr:3-dehydroquinate synthase [Ruminococcaceae bacterium OttesenSCG-928-A16]
MKLAMNLGTRSYDIILKDGSLARASQLCNLNRKVLVVTDDGVPPEYAQTLLQQCGQGHLLVVPQGEGSKSVAVWQTVLARLLQLDFGRSDAVAAVGGGVVGDLAGFAAASYMRGIDFFQFPTTTLSQVDSSIGGKVAINLAGTKNIVGAFYQPSLVVVDPATLTTLPRRQFAAGLAEALKAGLTGSPELFEIFEKEDIDENLERILFLSLLYKKQIVEQDETEQGNRMLLNFGHTVGHGIEAACGLGTGAGGLLHGECVALGMLPMIESKTLQRRVRAILKKLGLPLKYSCTPAEIVKHMQHDKKRSGGKFTVVRVKKVGEGYLESIDFEELRLLVEGSQK